jgi:hypothetical protein
VKKVVVAVLVVVGVLLGLAVVADRAAASVAANQISAAVAAKVPGATSVSTSIEGVPLLTQVARGSLDHVTVSMSGVPTDAGLTLDSVVVDLRHVSTTSPRTAGTVHAEADVSDAALSAKLGDGWDFASDGDVLVISSTGSLPVSAHVTPNVDGGMIGFHLDSVSVLGLTVSGDSIPSSLTDRVTALAGQIGQLPLGLAVESVSVTSTGVHVVASGTDVVLEG